MINTGGGSEPGLNAGSGPAGEIGGALAPLRERYAHWLQLDAQQVLDDRDEAAQDIRAMQLVLRMERADPPSWHRALAAEASGAAAICIDERSEPGGPWHDAIGDYCRGHIPRSPAGRGARTGWRPRSCPGSPSNWPARRCGCWCPAW